MDTSDSGFVRRIRGADGIEIECIETPDGVFHLIVRNGSAEEHGWIDRDSARRYFGDEVSVPSVEEIIAAMRACVQRAVWRDRTAALHWKQNEPS
jgi:hypothetical protein